MADTVRTTIHLSREAYRLLIERTSPRGRGEYISELILRDEGSPSPGVGISERIERKVDKVIELLEGT